MTLNKTLMTLSHWSIVQAKKYHLSINTKKSRLSIIYYQEIYEILQTLAGYHLKSKNGLIKDDTRNIAQASFKLIEAKLISILFNK
jgi:hypothetical protein